VTNLALASRTARAFENKRLKSSREIIDSRSRSKFTERRDMKWSTRMFMLFRYDTSELMISNCACQSVWHNSKVLIIATWVIWTQYSSYSAVQYHAKFGSNRSTVRNQTVSPCAEWWCEMDNQATTPSSYWPSTAFLPVRPLREWHMKQMPRRS